MGPASFILAMPLSRIFRNGAEYGERYVKHCARSKHFAEWYSSLGTPFSPPNVTLKEVHDAVPKALLRRRILPLKCIVIDSHSNWQPIQLGLHTTLLEALLAFFSSTSLPLISIRWREETLGGTSPTRGRKPYRKLLYGLRFGGFKVWWKQVYFV